MQYAAERESAFPGQSPRQPRCSTDDRSPRMLEGSLAKGPPTAGPMWISMSPCRTPVRYVVDAWLARGTIPQRDGRTGHPAPGHYLSAKRRERLTAFTTALA